MSVSVKNSLAFSCVLTFIVLPFLTVGLFFYHLFSGEKNNQFLFNTISLNVQDNASFTFSLDPSYFLLMALTFILTFTIVWIIHRIKRTRS